MQQQNPLRKKILSNMQSVLFWSTINKDLYFSTISIQMNTEYKIQDLNRKLTLKLDCLSYQIERNLNYNFCKTL